MSPEQFNKLFPNATDDVRKRNAHLLDTWTPPVVEPDPRPRALVKIQAKEGSHGRFRVRVTSVRNRLLDEDNLCEKYVVDCCRYAGLIPGDAPGQTKIEVDQRKCAKGEEEHIEVSISKMTT